MRRVQASFTSTRRWALALRPEHHPGSDQPGHVEEHARSRGVEEPLVVGETRSTTLLVADPPTALAVTAEGASCAARAVLSDSVSCMLAVSRLIASRMVFRAQDESPAPRWRQTQRESCNASAAEANKFA